MLVLFRRGCAIMGFRMTESEREAIHFLWDEVADFPTAKTDDALVHFMEGVSRMINAGNAFWLGALLVDPTATRDPLLGWRPRANRYLYPGPVHDEAYRNAVAKMYRGEADETSRVAVRNAGTFRSFRIRQTNPPEWFEGEYYQARFGARGFHDSCYAIFPLHTDCESYFAFHRVGVRKNFTAREEAIAAFAVRGIKWFHRQLILSHGVMFAEGPLSPMQRQIVQLLLTGHSEKEIAFELDHSPHTTHRHITDIFRKYGVSSRASLMALWLGQKS